ncbi:MAG: bacillithiol biosynthesis deacetylase BshB1 [Acidobacteriota bacterium]
MVDILIFGAHPDDAEIFMGGAVFYLKTLGYRVGVCDLTNGEAGTYGSGESRRDELKNASAMMGLDFRMTLDLQDGNIRNTKESRMKVIDVIRSQRPKIIFSFSDELVRHPDHKYCGEIVRESSYLSGLEKIGGDDPPHRPDSYIAFPELTIKKRPDFIIDITPYMEKKKEVIRCYGTQVTAEGEDDSGTKTLIRSNNFWEILESRALQAGAMGGIRYGEPFYSPNPPVIPDPVKSFSRQIV